MRLLPPTRRCDTSDTPDNAESVVTDSALDQDAVEVDRGHGGLRRCIVTRSHAAPETMLRFVVSPDGIVTPDLSARLPGRGIWLSARRDVLETARTRHMFSKAARQAVQVPDDLDAVIRAGLEQRVIESVTLARRAGQALCGFTKCREWIVARKVGAVIQSFGASPDELARLLSGARELPVATIPAGMLAKAFGREHAVYGVVARGALARRLLIEHERFLGLAEGPVPGAPDMRAGVEQAGK